jgi:hypothetical protein
MKRTLLKKTHMPNALSIVEGSFNRLIGTGVMEWWSVGFETQYSNIPLFQHSIVCSRLASEIFLSSLQSGYFSNTAPGHWR